MDSKRFDGIVRRFGQPRTRRQTLRGLAGLAAVGVVALGGQGVDAGKRNGGAPCTKGRQCKTGKCKGDPGQKVCTCSTKYPKCTTPDTTCQGGTCTDPNACSNPATTCDDANCGPPGTDCMCLPRVGSPGAVCINRLGVPNIPCLSETTGGCSAAGLVCVNLGVCNFPSPLCLPPCV